MTAQDMLGIQEVFWVESSFFTELRLLIEAETL